MIGKRLIAAACAALLLPLAAAAENTVGILLPNMDKNELFSSVAKTGPFPKKSFSIGLGPDKRYYLECRAL